ncbi:hypothetical protein Tco_0666985 [Tanacetum coccineum]
MFEVGQGSGSAPEFERPERVSASRQPTLTTWTDPEDATPATAETKGFLTELGAQVEMQGGLIRDHPVRLEDLSSALFERYDRDIGELFTRSGAVRDEIFSQRCQFRNLEYEQERVAVIFGAIWRPGKNRDLRLQLAEERHVRLKLAEVVDDMRRGQEPRGGWEEWDEVVWGRRGWWLWERERLKFGPVFQMEGGDSPGRVQKGPRTACTNVGGEHRYARRPLETRGDRIWKRVMQCNHRMSTPVFAYLDGTDTESEPFQDPFNTETPESPLAIAPPISLSESTPPVLVPILRKTARMDVRVPHAMSSGLFASMAEVAAMSESTLRKRFWSSYESSPSVSPPDLLSRKRYHDTSELVEDSEENDDEEDEEIEESMDSNSVSEDVEDEGPTAEDEDPTAENEGLTVRVEGPGMDDEGYGLDDERHEKDEEAVAGGQQQAALVVGTTGSGSALESERPERVSAFRQPTLTIWTDLEDGMIYIDILDYPPLAPPVQTPPSPEWTSGSLPISPSHSDVPSPISSPIIPLTVPSPVATPAKVETERFLTELGAQVEMQGD